MTVSVNKSVRHRLHNPALGPLNDFKNVLYLVWKHLKLPKPTPIQLDVANFLQHGPEEFELDDPKRNRQVITGFRGMGKTWITAAFVCWCLLMDGDLRILITSKSGSKAEEIAQFIRRLLIEMPVFAHLDPNSSTRNTTIAFDIAGAKPDPAPSVKVLGIDGQLAGSRADIIIPDDVETLQNALTQFQRDKLIMAVKEFDSIVKPGGLIIYLGTPQVEDSLYEGLADKGYSVRIWPARFPTVEQMKKQKYHDRLAPMVLKAWSDKKAWQVVDTARFSEEDLVARELSYGKAGFYLQFMLDTELSNEDRYPLKLQDLIVAAFSGTRVPVAVHWGKDRRTLIEDPELPAVGMAGDRLYRPIFISDQWAELEEIVMSIDPSGRGADETSFAIVGFYRGMLYLLEAGGFVGGYDEATLTSLAMVAAKWKVHRVIPENNFGDGMFTQLFKPILFRHHRCAVDEDYKSRGMKELRICDTLEPVIASHRLVVLEDVMKKDLQTVQKERMLFYQMTRILRQRQALKHDDRLDALAIAISYFVDKVNQDVKDAEEVHKVERRTAALERFLEAFDAGYSAHTSGADSIYNYFPRG